MSSIQGTKARSRQSTKGQRMTMRLLGLGLVAATGAMLWAAGENTAFREDFEKMKEGKPQGFVILCKPECEVKKVDGNNVLEFPPDPLAEDARALFGSAEQISGTLSARVLATAVGKRFPEFGLGLNRSGAYRVWLMPAVGQVQIRSTQGSVCEVVANAPYAWKSGQWTHLKLRVSPAANGKVTVTAKAWPAGQAEPEKWAMTYESSEPAGPDRASLWALPYSGTPISFDDLQIDP